MSEETDHELNLRHCRVEQLIAETRRKAEKMQHGLARDLRSRFIGGLQFTLLQIESELRERGLMA